MPPKRIVIACDGTWNRPDQVHGTDVTPSNVVKIALAVDDDAPGQDVFYERGVGTSGALADHVVGGAFGVGLSRNVLEPYRYLIDAYEPGDELFLFGFSRGAFTARSLAGLIGNCGILRPEHTDKVDEAYTLYRSRAAPTKPTGIEARLFRKTYAHDDVRIRFIGVWDTVGALGVPLQIPALTKRWSFHDVQLGLHVDQAVQALAIDERRRPFQPTPWVKQPEAPPTQRLEQVWFAGVHSDVGGGYPNPTLADITLLWMADRAGGAGLAFHDGWFTRAPVQPGSKRRQTGEDVHPDALGQLHDSMTLFYRLMGPKLRTLLETPNGSVASSVIKRINDRPSDYHPSNLTTYLETEHPPTTEVVDATP
jgi:uncharacterized protein (DUF2235 family)